jgi:hypothetical protein
LIELLAHITAPAPSDSSGVFCPWLCSPDGPSTPFGTAYIAIADSIRVLCYALGLGSLTYMPSAIYHSTTRDQRLRFYGLSLFIIVAVTTESAHLGDLPSYRLVLNILGCLATAYGMFTFNRKVRARDP